MKAFSTRSRLVCFMVMVIFVAQSSTAIAGNPLREEGAQPAPGPAYVSALDAGVTIPEGVQVSSADRAILSQITAEQYRELMAGTDPATMVARDGRMVDQVIGEAQGDVIDPPNQTFGNNNNQLVYTPIEPCRVIDTDGAGGHFSAGETRSYTIGGVTNYSSIGGSATGCSPQLPGSEGDIFGAWERVRAYHINIVAAAPTGGGNFTVWPANLTSPTASTINFQALTPNLNIANGVIIKNCTDTTSIFDPPGAPPLCDTGDLSFMANFSGARLVVDVLGYYTRADVETVKPALSQGIVGAGDGFQLSGSCENIASCIVYPTRLGSGNVQAGYVLVQASVQFDALGATNPSFFIYLSDVDGTTCFPATDTGLTSFDSADDGYGYMPLSMTTAYPIPADTLSQTLYLNVSGSTSVYLTRAHMNCLWIPN